ncbi:hypothetical protein Tco_0276160 [Tanacetum coccineum]
MGPTPSTVKKKPEKSNKQMGLIHLRRSERGKNPVDVHASNLKSTEKSVVTEEGSRDSNGGSKKRKRYDAGEFKSRKSPRFQKHMGPTTRFAVKKKPEKSEKIGSTPLRRSERGKNPVDVPALNVKACYKPQQVRVETDSGGNEIDKFDNEWDEKKKTIVNDFSLEKTLIRNRYGSNSSVRSEKLYLVEKEFADKFTTRPRFLDLVESEKENQESREVAPALLGNPIVPDGVVNLGDSSNDMVSGSHTSEKHMANATVVADATALSEPTGDIPAKHVADMGNDVAGADTTALSEPIGDIPAKHVADMGNDVAGADASSY